MHIKSGRTEEPRRITTTMATSECLILSRYIWSSSFGLFIVFYGSHLVDPSISEFWIAYSADTLKYVIDQPQTNTVEKKADKAMIEKGLERGGQVLKIQTRIQVHLDCGRARFGLQ